MIERGHVYWVDLEPPRRSGPARRRPVVVISDDAYNRSALSTVVVVAMTSTTSLAALPGNVFLPGAVSGLPRDSVVNVTAVLTVDKAEIGVHAGRVPEGLMEDIGRGLRRVLGLVVS